MNLLRPHLVLQIADMTRNSYTIRGIAKALGIHKETVARHQRELGLNILNCGCGKSIRHRGWCSFRFSRSTARQEFMTKWHPQSLYEVEGAFGRLDNDPTYFGE